MIDIKKLTADYLTDPKNAEEVLKEGQALYTWESLDTKKFAEKIADELHLDQDRRLSGLELEYSQLVSKLRFAGLWNYDEKEIESFFQKRMYDAIGLEEYNILDRLRARMLKVNILDRDPFKKQLREALLRNQQPVGSTVIEVNGQKMVGTVANWFKDYFGTIGLKDHTTYQLVRYTTASKNFQKLRGVDQGKLRSLFVLYELLGVSSRTLEGVEEVFDYEDDDGTVVTFEGGVPVRLDLSPKGGTRRRTVPVYAPAPVGEEGRLSKLLKSAVDYVAQFKPFESAVKAESSDDAAAVRKSLIEAIERKDVRRTVGCLLVLAKMGRLQSLMLDMPSWREVLAAHMERTYHTGKARKYIDTDPTDPTFISELLQYILIKQLGVSVEHSAMIAMELDDRMGDPYRGMAFADEETGRFLWVPHDVQTDGKAPVAKSLDELLEFAKQRMRSWFLAEKVLKGKIGGSSIEMKKQLVTGLKNQDVGNVVGVLLLMAREGILQNALKDGANWRDTVKSYIAEKYETTNASAFIDERPADPAVMSEFLQYLLQKRLGLSENESAMVGMELGDRMGEEYRTLAYADEDQGAFAWVKNKVQGNKLVQEL